ncbi:SDR family NAD(P)-dependent oxidoreductase [Glaciimonas sp. GNP009]
MTTNTTRRLEGKVMLVTGGGRGIGRAISNAFAREGAHVGILDIKGEIAEEAAQAIRAEGGSSVGFTGDVSQRDSFIRTIDALQKQFGRFDGLVNNAIWVRYGAISSITPEMLDRMVGSGFNSVIWGMQAAGAAMEGCGGSIINIASVAGYLGMSNAAAYCGIKAGVMGLTRAAATDFGPSGIRVNAIAPGAIPTDGAMINVDEQKMQQRISKTPLRRLGTVDDIASAACFLASDESSFITGEILTVDGGIARAFL